MLTQLVGVLLIHFVTSFGAIAAGTARQVPFDCVAELKGPEAERVFDRQFDRTWDGRSYSCDLAMRASDARRALEALRAGFVYGDRHSLRSAVLFPVKVSIRKTLDATEQPQEHVVNDEDALLAFSKIHFSRDHFAMIACAQVSNTVIVKSRTYGFFIGDSFMLLQNSIKDAVPRVVRITVMPPDDGRRVRMFCAGSDNSNR